MPDLEELWTVYNRRVYAYMWRALHDYDVTQDLVSCTYMRALVATTNGNGATSNAERWLFTIARSVLLDFFRSRRRVTFEDIDEWGDLPDDLPTPHECHERAMTCQQVRLALSKIPEGQAVAIELGLEGYAWDEVGEVLGISHESAKARATRGRVHLRELLQEAA